MPLEDVQLYILQDAIYDFWLQAPWRWSIGALAAQQILAGAQVTTLTASLPTDYLYLLDAHFTDGQDFVPLSVEAYLPSGSAVKGVPNKVSLIVYPPILSTQPVFILDPIPTSLPNANNWYIWARYKKMAPVLTPVTIRQAGTQLFDDEYFPVFKQCVLYYAYLWGDDQRAGTMQAAQGQTQATGQLGVYKGMLDMMRAQEGLITVYKPKTQDERQT